jgi:hypothetical protein
MSWAWRSCDPPERTDHADVPDRVRELRPPGRLQVREQVELAGVVGAVARSAAERHDAERVAAAAEGAGNQVRWIHSVLGPADDARPAGDRGTLGVGGSHRWSGVVRRSGFPARSLARRRSGVRFIDFSSQACG